VGGKNPLLQPSRKWGEGKKQKPGATFTVIKVQSYKKEKRLQAEGVSLPRISNVDVELTRRHRKRGVKETRIMEKRSPKTNKLRNLKTPGKS